MTDTKEEASPENLASAFSEFVEIQRRIEESARRIVESVRHLVDSREHLAPANLKDFAGYDHRFYDMTGKELADQGLRVLGDFADPSVLDGPVDRRSFYRFALSEDGTTTASWFVARWPRDSRGFWLRFWSMLWPNAKKEPIRVLVLHSWCEDGRSFVTTRGSLKSHLMRPERLIVQEFDKYVSAARVLEAHRAAVAAGGGVPRRLRTIEEIFAARTAESEMTNEFRRAKGLELFEPKLRGMLGDEYDERGAPLVEAILAHPEWWTGSQKATPPSPPSLGERASSASSTSPGEQEASPSSSSGARSDSPVRLMFLNSREGGRGHLTTLGLLFEGLPEMQMKQLAANHWLAARFLVATVAKKLRDRARVDSGEAFGSKLRTGLTLTLRREDVSPRESTVVSGRYQEASAGAAGPAVVRLILETFDETGDDPDNELVHLVPPLEYRADKDTWLRDVCRSLGHNAPDPLPLESLDAEMQAASDKARTTLGAVRDQFRRGLPAGQTLAIKIGLTTTAGGREFVWIKVNEWQDDGILIGTLETEPNECPGFLQGQVMRVPESDVFDRAIGTPEGMIDLALTDIIAQEFGVDL